MTFAGMNPSTSQLAVHAVDIREHRTLTSSNTTKNTQLKRENAVECETMNMQLKRELQEAGVLSSKARQSEPQIDNILYHWTGFVHSLGLISSEGRKLTP
jgi:hypothetical protein